MQLQIETTRKKMLQMIFVWIFSYDLVYATRKCSIKKDCNQNDSLSIL